LGFFEWLEKNMTLLLTRDKDALSYVIERSCINKAEIVAEDEFEAGIRAILNLGHTFGHAIETGMGYGEYLHGEAVSIGIGYAADLSRRMEWITKSDVSRILSLLKRAKLPVVPPKAMDVSQFIDLMSVDKKNVDGKIRLILLESIGKATLPINIDQSLLEQTLKNYAG
jgi:3-dehydroquinate synthase